MARWSKEELKGAIEVYLEMLEKQRRGKSFNIYYYRQLAKKYSNRNENAFERRLMNISYIYSLQGREWVVGLLPLPNVGSNVINKIESILSELENRSFDENIAFQAKIDDLKITDKLNPPKGIKNLLCKREFHLIIKGMRGLLNGF